MESTRSVFFFWPFRKRRNLWFDFYYTLKCQDMPRRLLSVHHVWYLNRIGEDGIGRGENRKDGKVRNPQGSRARARWLHSPLPVFVVQLLLFDVPFHIGNRI